MKKENSDLFIISIIAIVAIVALFWMVQSSQQVSDISEQQVIVVDEDGNVIGMAGWWADGFKGKDKGRLSIIPH